MNTQLIGVKYCGGCNPVIERVGLVEKIKKILPEGYTVTTDVSCAPWDTGIMVCGCASACVDRPRIRNLARNWIVVAGKSVDLAGSPEEKMAEIIVGKLICQNKP